MKKHFLFVLAFLFFILSATPIWSEKHGKETNNKIKELKTTLIQNCPYKEVYDSLQLNKKGLSLEAFKYSVNGFLELKNSEVISNDSVITIVNFDQPSNEKRMYIIDLKNSKMLFYTWTAHGRNSGTKMAVNFSNKMESKKSSLGLYITEEPYFGKNGYSLKLEGLDKTNSNAYDRGIVLHGAWYVSQAEINNSGYIGRSWGCPAVSPGLSKPIINRIKNGSCFVIYSHQLNS